MNMSHRRTKLKRVKDRQTSIAIVLFFLSLFGAISIGIVNVLPGTESGGGNGGGSLSSLISIVFNNNQRVFGDENLFIAPGDTIEKEITLENKSKTPIHFKIYFDGLSGELNNILRTSFYFNDGLLKTGKLSEINKDNYVRNNPLIPMPAETTYTLTLILTFPEEYGNEYQGDFAYFDFVVVAVEARNNPEQDFT